MASSSSSIRNRGRDSIADNNHNDPLNTSIAETTHTHSLLNSPKLRILIEDRRLLECQICFERFKLDGEIISCLANGHSVCNKCVNGMSSKSCPYCRDSDLATRNIGLELILKATSAPCQNNRFGCSKRLMLVDHVECAQHNSVCPYTQCVVCPLCDFSGTGSLTNLHFNSNHSTQQTNFSFDIPFTFDTETNQSFFQEETTLSPIFILNQSLDIDANQRRFEVQCLAPPHNIYADGQSYLCTITIFFGDRTDFNATFTPTFCCKWDASTPTNKFLPVSLSNGVISKGTLLIRRRVPSKA